MPNGVDGGLTRIPVIGPIIGVLGGLFGGGSSSGTRGPRTRRVLPTFPHPPVPPTPQVGTTTEDSFATPGGVVDVSTSSPTTTSSGSDSTTTAQPTNGETDRERRRRERREARERANRRTNVSILSAFQTGLGVLQGIAALRTRAAPAMSPILAAGMQQPAIRIPTTIIGNALPALPGIGSNGGRMLGGFGTTRSGQHVEFGSRPPSGFHFAKDGSGKIVRNRTMNVLNLHAAKRAIRRIKGARKVLRSIESSLPKRASSSTRKRR